MKLDPSNPKDREFLEKHRDSATGKSLLEITLEANKKSAQKTLASLDKNDQKKEKTKSRYSNKRVEVDGIKFDSKKEAARYSELKLEERVGFVRDIEVHKNFDLVVNEVKISTYIADLVYIRRDAYGVERLIVEDVKEEYFLRRKGSADYRLYRMKKSLMLALYGITITEIT